MNPNAPKVVVTGGNGSLATVLAEVLRGRGWTADAPGRAELDVTSDDSVARFFDGRKIDLLICNAGITRDQPLARMDPAAWDDVWTTNFRGATRCIQAALPSMRESGAGHIILISSRSALHPPSGQTAYAAAKAALLGLVRDLAPALGIEGIRINAILPGFLETRMTTGVTETRKAAVLAEHALGRFNTCEAVAGFIRFLHEELPHTSSQTFQLDSRPA